MKVLVMFALVLWGADTQGSDGQETQQEQPRILCGRVLAETRMLLCLTKSEEAKNKSVETPLTASMYPRAYRRGGLMRPWLAGRSKEGGALKLTRAKRIPGLVDECCHKPCYNRDLLNYC
ncbi:bombyxin B-1 homolog [Pectinophora gossypiella]|uniref:bombyxin B-1 homolog n=1 Tax=Pectinophora gossypiella TaxID=13191 RepID=UPI00214E8992|nr:bombyxin B-1 homolog [Pectinophora gossypiella]